MALSFATVAAAQVESYQQPYEEFVGSNPVIEDMKVVVVDKHCRPDFPSSFYNNPVSGDDIPMLLVKCPFTLSYT